MHIPVDEPVRQHQWVLRHDDMAERLVLEHTVDGAVSEVGSVSLRHPAFVGNVLAVAEATRLLMDQADTEAGFALSWEDVKGATILGVSEIIEL